MRLHCAESSLLFRSAAPDGPALLRVRYGMAATRAAAAAAMCGLATRNRELHFSRWCDEPSRRRDLGEWRVRCKLAGDYRVFKLTQSLLARTAESRKPPGAALPRGRCKRVPQNCVHSFGAVLRGGAGFSAFVSVLRRGAGFVVRRIRSAGAPSGAFPRARGLLGALAKAVQLCGGSPATAPPDCVTRLHAASHRYFKPLAELRPPLLPQLRAAAASLVRPTASVLVRAAVLRGRLDLCFSVSRPCAVADAPLELQRLRGAASAAPSALTQPVPPPLLLGRRWDSPRFRYICEQRLRAMFRSKLRCGGIWSCWLNPSCCMAGSGHAGSARGASRSDHAAA
jgi:hypothetical protein